MKRLARTTAALLLSAAMTPAFALDIQGHRGARGLLPENTLPAFARALALGVTTLELDCGITRDGVVVIHHDRTLNPDIARDAHGRRIADAPALRELTYAELRRYDVGRLRPDTPYAKRFPRQQALDGTRIPRLADLFELVRRLGDGRVRFNLETKLSPLAPEDTATPEEFVRALLEAIRTAGMEARVAIQSFDWRTLRMVQERTPAIPTVYLTAEKGSPRNVSSAADSAWTAGFQLRDHGGSLPRMVKAAGGAIWSPAYGDLTRERVSEAQSLGLKVIPWTVNAEADMRRLIEWGVDGLITDYPDVARRATSGRELRTEGNQGFPP